MNKRNVLASVSTAIFSVVLTTKFGPSILLLVTTGSFLMICVYGIIVDRKIQTLESAIIEEHENQLVRQDEKGNVQSLIDLNTPFTVFSSYFGYPDTRFKIKQGNTTLEFSTKTEKAEHIFGNVLRIKGDYPPVRR